MRGKNNSYKSNNTNNNNGNQSEVYVNSVVRQKNNNNDNLWMGKLIRENTRCECLHNIDSIRPVNCVALDPAKLILICVSLCCCCCCCQRWLSCFQISYSFSISSWTGFFSCWINEKVVQALVLIWLSNLLDTWNEKTQIQHTKNERQMRK